MSASNLHIAWARLLLRSLWHAGVRDVIVSPGSRSTPLALAADASPELSVHFLVDERTAGFFALGQARVTGRPSALVCTSGTAAAHYFPAVIEASMSGVPMIVVTADRPWEVQQAGASQTIDQHRLFGVYTRFFAALGAPEPTPLALRALARTAAQAASRALGPEPGPVHLNAPFRKPLEPAASPSAEPWTPTFEALMEAGPTRAVPPTPTLDPASIEAIARLVRASERGLLVCGPAPSGGDLDAHRREVCALAQILGFPVLAEATSQLRFGAPLSAPSAGPCADAPPFLGPFDALLRSPAFRASFSPDLLIELGAPPTSTGYAQLLAASAGPAGARCPRVVVAPLGWTDPESAATCLVNAPIPLFCRALREHFAAGAPISAREAVFSWSRAVAAADAAARSVVAATATATLDTSTIDTSIIDTSIIHTSSIGAHSPFPEHPSSPPTPALDVSPTPLLTGTFNAGAGVAEGPSVPPRSRRPDSLPPAAVTDPLTEGVVARAVTAACPARSVLVIGNSSPVRDLDLHCPPSPVPLAVVHQRGAAGIDGLVSGAAGAQVVSGRPVTLLLGDLSFLHDIGGLAAARLARGPLVIVVVNNGGGRIFEQLPISRAVDAITFERCFATPQPLDLRAAARAFSIGYELAVTPAELSAALRRAHAAAAPAPLATLVEAIVPPHDAASRARALSSRIDALFHPRKDASQ